MVGCSPFEKQPVIGNVNLLEETIPDVVGMLVLFCEISERCHIFGIDLVDCDECCALWRYYQLMEICGQVVHGRNLECLLVGGIELASTISHARSHEVSSLAYLPYSSLRIHDRAPYHHQSNTIGIFPLYNPGPPSHMPVVLSCS